MFSQPLMKKWEKILKEKYNQKNLNKKEIFEIANFVSEYFCLLAKFELEDKSKIEKYEPNKTNKS